MSRQADDLDVIRARLGLEEMPEILEACATPVRRGHHLALLAGEGSGRTSVVGLAVLEACDAGEEALQALVLVPEAGGAWRMAAALQRIVGPEGFTVDCPSAAPGPERVAEDATGERPPAHVLVGRPSKLLPEIRAGRHSIAALRLLVLDRIADLHALDEWSSVEPILETLPEGSRKMAISNRLEPSFLELLSRQLPRARRWPEELIPLAAPGDATEADDAEEDRPLVRCAVAEEGEFPELFEACVRDADGLGCEGVELVLPSPEAAARAAAKLTVAGLEVAPTSDGGRTVSIVLPGQGPAAVVHVGLPLRVGALAEAFDGEGPRYAIVPPRHLPQALLDVRRLGRRAVPLGQRLSSEAMDPVDRFRSLVREAASSADMMSELLVLEPLFAELGTVRVAAALSGLLRARGPDAGISRPWADVEAASYGRAAPGGPGGPAPGAERPAPRGRPTRRDETPPRGARQAWTRLYLGVGRRDEARPEDLVGAITGETGIAGGQVGKIEMMGNFSLVDIDSQVVDEVIRKLDGVQIRGRTVPVRRDREA